LEFSRRAHRGLTGGPNPPGAGPIPAGGFWARTEGRKCVSVRLGGGLIGPWGNGFTERCSVL